ncbi:MAG TPA: tetratricopeptide repeat protein [Phycisphaerae bacterium]|nr:tetratricopeptide repeat protein [Phycisphaerae bacterium]
MPQTKKLSVQTKPRISACIVALVVVVLAAYANSFWGVFLLDDTRAIVENRRIHQLWPIGPILSGPRPIVDLSLAVNYAISGVKPWSYHALNLVIHVLAALMLFGVVRRTLGRIDAHRLSAGALPLAFAAALVWAVHPLHTQAVTYVIQRSESMMGLFYLLTLYWFARGAETNWRRWFALSVIACALGMCSKAVMVSAPVVVLLYDRAFFAGNWRDVFRRRWGVHLALAATWSILAVTGVLRGIVETSPEAHVTVGFGVTRSTPVEYALTQAGVILHYLRLAIWPHPLCLDYAWPITKKFGDAALPLAGIVLLLAATIWAWIRRPALGFLGAAFFLILAPTSSFVPIQDAAFEHRMYLPLAAIVLLFMVAVAHRFLRYEGATTALLVAIAIVLASVTHHRNKLYASSFKMWTDVVFQRPLNVRAYNNMGNALVADGKPRDAIPVFETALQIGGPNATIHFSYGVALAAVSRTDEAIAQYREALLLFPDFAKAHNNLGQLIAGRRDYEEAMEHFQAALRIDSDYAEARYNLALALNAVGRLGESVEHYRRALNLRPNEAGWHNNLAAALTQIGQFDEAVKEFNAALRLNPNYFNARYNLATLLENRGRPAEAAGQYLEALKLRPDHKDARRRLDIVLKKLDAASQPSTRPF